MDRSTLELREHFGTCEHSYGHWIDLSLPHGRYPLWQLLRQYPDVALPQNRDIAPLRLVSWVSCEVPNHVQQVLHQLMTLFGQVTPVSSDEVIAIGIPTTRGDWWRNLLGHGQRCADSRGHLWGYYLSYGGSVPPHGCFPAASPAPSPRALPGYDTTTNGPCFSPLVSQEGDGLPPLTVSPSAMLRERGVWEYTLNATKLFWSRSGIMHVAIAWDHKPLLLLATALLPNRSTESFEREAGPPYDKQRIQMGLRSGNTVLLCFRSGVWPLPKCTDCSLPLTYTQTSRGRDSISFGSMFRQFVPTLLGYRNSLARTYCSAALDRRS